MGGNLRMQMSILAQALINEGKNTKAKNVLDKCLAVIPEENVPYDGTIFTIAAAYYQIGEKQKAGELAQKLFTIYESDLGIYNKQKGNHRISYQREMEQAKEIMKRLTGIAQQFKDEKLAKEFMMRLSKIVPPEELMPEEGQQQEPQPIELK